MNDRLAVSDATTTLRALQEQFVPCAYTRHHPIVASRGEGAWVEDIEGRRYLDFAGGIGVLNVGQRHAKVVEALHAQVERLLHTGPVMMHDGYIKLAARIAQTVSADEDLQVLFVNSGAEAVENAIKIARHATGRTAVIAFDGSFHGRTLLTNTLNGKVGPYKLQPGPMAPEIHHAAYPNPFRPPLGVSQERIVDYCLSSLDRIVEIETPPEKVAAVIVEPLQGEGGYVVPPQGFLTGVRSFCDRIGALLIIDEIQTGYGRTGRMFAYEWEPVRPDILTLGKSLADGLPLTAVVAPKAIFEKVALGDIGGTYGGNPVACAAGLAVLDAFEAEGLLKDSERKGLLVRESLEALAAKTRHIGDVRGIGTMLAVEFVEDRSTRAPAGELVNAIVTRAREKGLITIKAGPYGTVIRILVPLVASEEELETGMAMFGEAVTEVCAEHDA
jgi:4-aminobutyrate aminotransferase/(S)-3-amino-2-methylpropionate transaminase